jgi:hypothetical protein
VVDARRHCRRLAAVATQLDHAHASVPRGDRLETRKGPIAAAIIDKDDLKAPPERRHRGHQRLV